MANGWTKILAGNYAFGPFRVQGRANHWHWWHVVQFGGTEHLRGWTKSCGDAMAAVERALLRAKGGGPSEQGKP